MSLRGTASFDVFCVKIRAGVLAVDDMSLLVFTTTKALSSVNICASDHIADCTQ